MLSISWDSQFMNLVFSIVKTLLNLTMMIIMIEPYNTEILSFLKHKRERTVNVIFQTVYFVNYERFLPFNVPNRS
jgi:hypothetical protein